MASINAIIEQLRVEVVLRNTAILALENLTRGNGPAQYQEEPEKIIQPGPEKPAVESPKPISDGILPPRLDPKNRCEECHVVSAARQCSPCIGKSSTRNNDMWPAEHA